MFLWGVFSTFHYKRVEFEEFYCNFVGGYFLMKGLAIVRGGQLKAVRNRLPIEVFPLNMQF